MLTNLFAIGHLVGPMASDNSSQCRVINIVTDEELTLNITEYTTISPAI